MPGDDLRAEALLVVDVQRALVTGDHAVGDAGAFTQRLAHLVDQARAAGVAVVQLQDEGMQDRLIHRGTEGWELALPAAPGEVVVRKQQDDGFSGTDLAAVLAATRASRICVVGIQSEMCVAATARGALARGYTVLLPRDGHTTYDVPEDGPAAGVPAALVSRVAEWSLGDRVVVPGHTTDVRFTRPPDAIFADPRLAGVYDVFDDPRDDLDTYDALIDDLGAERVLDVGCGTGSFALRLAARGVAVVAVDPAAASLAVARAKRGSELVRWVHGDATTLPAIEVDVAVMTGNVAQVFVGDQAWAATLDGIRAALPVGGHLVLESRRPSDRAWEGWREDGEPLTRDVPGVGSVTQRLTVRDVEPPLVSLRHDFTFPDGTTIGSDSTLRFRTLDELEATLSRSGFRVADVGEAPDRPGREYVVVAQAR